jgi:hypothetical protein
MSRTSALGIALLLFIAGCGDTDPPDGIKADTSSTSTSSGTDDQPDTYNDKDNDGAPPAEG